MSVKNQLLAYLEQARGQDVSGQMLADKFNVSRNAIWKAVNELKNEGYIIGAVPNKGYRLLPSTNILSVHGIAPYLADSGDINKIHIFKELESTNLTAKKMAVDGCEHGTVVIADSQTAGRGRLGRSFFSPPGSGLYISFVLKPDYLPADSAALITTAAAVIVSRVVKGVTGVNAQIKWVNDVYANGKKICGILTEGVVDIENGLYGWIILGIGINYNARNEDFPNELRNKAGSLLPGRDGSGRIRIAAELINQICYLEDMIKNKDFLNEYRERSMVLGKRLLVTLPNESYEAYAENIDHNGMLIIRKDDGCVVTLNAGEVSVAPI